MNKKIGSFKVFLKSRQWILYVLLGVINGLPFTFRGLFFLSWFAFAPFYVLAVKNHETGIKRRTEFLFIFLFFFSYHFSIYYFFLSLVPMSFMGIGFLPSLLLMLAAWVLLSAVHALMLSLPVFLAVNIAVSYKHKMILFSLVTVVAQYVMSFGTYGFTWARVSLPQSALLPSIQSAAFFGPYFVDCLLLLVNSFIALSYITENYKLYSTVAILMFSVNFFFGFVYMQAEPEFNSVQKATVIQGNVLTDSKWDGQSSYSTYMKQTLMCDESDTLIVWPETAVPTDLNDSKRLLSELETYTQMSCNQMIIGGFYCSNVGRELNGAYYLYGGKTSADVYFKRKLVPFGEFLPFRRTLSSLPFLSNINLYSVDLYPGYSSGVINARDGAIGCQICFDSIFPYLSRESTKDGAELLVILTNDSWYKDHPAVYQHNNHAIWRAVENRRYVVRCANSGISSFIDHNGRTLSCLPPLVQGELTEKVGYISELTLYTKTGDVIIIPILAVIVICLLISFNKSARLKRLSSI